MAFGAGHRVLVRVGDGSGFVLKGVRVVRVEADGAQEVQADEAERWDVEAQDEEDR
jgi:hypothetical protein